jgi:hypothetical protein
MQTNAAHDAMLSPALLRLVHRLAVKNDTSLWTSPRISMLHSHFKDIPVPVRVTAGMLEVQSPSPLLHVSSLCVMFSSLVALSCFIQMRKSWLTWPQMTACIWRSNQPQGK